MSSYVKAGVVALIVGAVAIVAYKVIKPRVGS